VSAVSPTRPAIPSVVPSAPPSGTGYGPSHQASRRPRPRRQPRRSAYPVVSVVVPTRNEARNLQIVLPRIAAVRPAVHEIIVVDGHSTDGSLDVARQVLPSVRTITQTRRGKGNAMACGFAAATGDVIVMFDADGSADPTEIPAFVAALVAGADFAKGSRFAAGGGSDDITLLRRTGNAGLNGVANALFGTSYTDLCYGYNAFWADLLPVLDLPAPDAPAPADGMLWGDGFEIETVLNCRVAAAGLKITEVPSVERQRIFGRTNLRTFADGTRVLRTLAAERRRAVRRHARGTGRLAGRRIGAEPLGYGYDGDGYDGPGYDTSVPAGSRSVHAGEREPGGFEPETDAFGPAGFREPPHDAHAFTSAGGVAVSPREPLDAAPDAGAGRSPRGAGRAHERRGPVGGSSANRDRSGVRYALEEEPS
jgi:Glycosyl transferase family 2